MKFECLECKRAFLYVAKRTERNPASAIEVEKAVCPYCGSLDFAEQALVAVEPIKMLDMVECEVGQVKEYLDKGYIVLDRYAKSIRLSLYEKPAAAQ